MAWGIEGEVMDRFAQAGVNKDNVSFARDTFVFRFHGSPAAFVNEFRHYYGPTMNAFTAAEKNGRGTDLQRELETLFTSQNQSGQSGLTVIPATYLRVVVNC
jgi:hypothetical protein